MQILALSRIYSSLDPILDADEMCNEALNLVSDVNDLFNFQLDGGLGHYYKVAPERH